MKEQVRNNLLWGLACVVLGAGCLAGFGFYYSQLEKTESLEQQLAELGQKEKQSVIVQHISTQMEEIAREQQIISDERRKEAEEQTIVANEMRMQAEQEQQRAHQAELAARESERKAVEASDVAETQRQLAVQRQQEAEYSRSVADTLSYIALARSLGAQAVNQQNTGNRELAALLSYASYLFTKRYNGDVYNPAIYEALALTSENNVQWSVGRGTITQSLMVPNTNNILALSNYGEITYNEFKNGRQYTRTIYANSKYDFRDIIIRDDTYYIISYTGHLLKVKGNDIQEVLLEGVSHPFRLFCKVDGQLIVTAERNVLLVDANTLKVIKTLPLNFECRIAGNDASHVYLFGVKGGMYSVDFQLSKVTSEKLPFSQPVTTCNFNIENGDKAFGTSDGTIYYFEPSGQMHRLVGHRSRISRVKFENDLLFSTSYDGTVKFWNTSYDKIEPITVMNTNQWIGTFTVSKDKEHIWTGEQNGNLNYTTISVELMADKVLANLKRNFTQEEWEYYIGNQIPFETFINKGK